MYNERNFLFLTKGSDRYMFFYDDESVESLIDVFNRYALDSNLIFDNNDALFLRERALKSQKSRLISKERLEQMF
ncbi:MAG: hypothetical protein AABW83_03225 [Nanoarchaeota archaeon]